MRVLLITTLYPNDCKHSIKETSWAVHELVKGLTINGIDVVKVIRPIPEIRWRSLKRNNIHFTNKIDNIEVETKTFINIPKGGYCFTLQDRKYFNTLLKEVDLVVAHMSDGAIMAHKLYKLFNKPYIYVLHNSDLLKVKKQKKIFKDAKAIYSRSWALSRQLSKKGINSNGVIYSGIEKCLIVPYREHNGQVIKIISVNLLQKLKNIDITIEALSELLDYSWEYTIIGDGEEFDSLIELVQKNGLEERVKFLGFKERSFCIEEMKKSDIFVMPSSPETFGLAYLEAMASGCLVIGAKDWGIDGLIEDRKDGYLVKARDKDDLKNTFIEIFTKDQSKIYKNSHRKIQKYTLEKAQINYAKILFENMGSKEKYKNFCQVEKDIPIFSRDWWLDCVCDEENWDVALVEKGGEVLASLPYYKIKRSIFDVIIMPKLTQTMGPYIKYPVSQKYYKKLSWEKEMMEKLIDALPEVDMFSQNFDKRITNWLPFYWNGFEQTTRYTYIIESDISLEKLEKNLETDIRRRRKKAVKHGVEVYEGEEIEEFYRLNGLTFIRQNRQPPYSLDFVARLYETCKEHGAVKMFFAKDKQGVNIAAAFFVYDDSSVYYLMGGIDPEKKDLGGMDLILYQGIKFALESGRAFDFEGSMIESIEKYFRSFGAIQKPYFNITKHYSKSFKLYTAVKDLAKAVLR